MVSSNPDFGYHFTGFATETESADSANDVVGNTNQLEKLISELSIDEVVIALKDKRDEFLDEIIIICNRNAVKTHIIPDYFKFISSRFHNIQALPRRKGSCVFQQYGYRARQRAL